MTKRFVVSENVPPNRRRAGVKAEVVDRTHPSDGGPVMIAEFASRPEADVYASQLNLELALAG